MCFVPRNIKRRKSKAQIRWNRKKKRMKVFSCPHCGGPGQPDGSIKSKKKSLNVLIIRK